MSIEDAPALQDGGYGGDVQSRTGFNARDTLRGAYDDATVFQAVRGQR